MVNVTFNGAVSAQATAGEIVTLTVTNPDATTDVFTALTQADKTFTTTRTYAVAGNYSIQVHIDADAQYEGATSLTHYFTIMLQSRTITVTVNVA